MSIGYSIPQAICSVITDRVVTGFSIVLTHCTVINVILRLRLQNKLIKTYDEGKVLFAPYGPNEGDRILDVGTATGTYSTCSASERSGALTT